jgi:hypothetical protein
MHARADKVTSEIDSLPLLGHFSDMRGRPIDVRFRGDTRSAKEGDLLGHAVWLMKRRGRLGPALAVRVAGDLALQYLNSGARIYNLTQLE